VPVALLLLLVRVGEARPSPALTASGVLLVAAGELLRLWAVRHIGVISRTRADRLGPLIVSGPFRIIRNPLYVGNLLLWSGFAVTARLLWMVPVVVLVIGFEYHAIVRWEEQLLLARRGDAYRAYTERVPRWLPSVRRRGAAAAPPAPYSWPDTLRSERGTLIAIAAGFLLLALKFHWR
jgi:protein-S-isoprenylcysteine O-methyltransferase Ste14